MSRPLPSLENLRCFIAAAETRNFRRAARHVALTPSAFGHRIRNLEDELGCSLFERTTRQVTLTPEGQRLVVKARETLDAAARCHLAVLDQNDTPTRIVLGTRFELGVSWLVPAVAALRVDRPHWTIDLQFGSGAEILEMLDRGAVDGVVTSAPIARADWIAEPLHDESYVFVGASAYLAKTPLNDATQAVNHALVDLDRTLPLARYLLSRAPPMRFATVLVCGTGAAVQRMVELEQGVAVLPRYMVNDSVRSGALVPILPEHEPLHDTFRLLFQANTQLSSTMNSLAAYLRAFPLR